jgi:outer membrane protein TolC
MCIFLTSLVAQNPALSLEDCINIALKSNPSININRNLNLSAEEDVLSSYSGILPLLNLSANSGRYEAGKKETEGDNIVGFDSTTQQFIYERGIISQPGYVTDFNQLSLSLNQNLVDGGEWWNAIKYAKSQKRSSDYNLESVINTVVQNVQERYFDLLKQQKLLEVNELAVQRSQDQLDKTQKMFELGAVAKVDVFRSKVNLGNDKIQMLLQKNALISAKNNLNLIMGRDPNAPISIKTEFSLKPAYGNLDELIETAWQNNPDLKRSEEDIYGYDLQVSRSYAALWPSLGAFFNYNRSNEFIERVYSGFDKNWTMNYGLGISVNLFNGFRDKTRIQKSKLAVRSAQEEFEELKRTTRGAIIQLIDNYNSYLQIIDINEDNLEAAKEEYRLAEERYRIGSGTALEVREAQVNLTRAEETLVAAQYNARITQAQLEQKLGIIFQAN